MSFKPKYLEPLHQFIWDLSRELSTPQWHLCQSLQKSSFVNFLLQDGNKHFNDGRRQFLNGSCTADGVFAQVTNRGQHTDPLSDHSQFALWPCERRKLKLLLRQYSKQTVENSKEMFGQFLNCFLLAAEGSEMTACGCNLISSAIVFWVALSWIRRSDGNKKEV